MQDEISRMPADDEERAEKGILSLLLASNSQRPWSIAELERERGEHLGTVDAFASLHAAGLIHRYGEFVFATRAAVRMDETSPRQGRTSASQGRGWSWHVRDKTEAKRVREKAAPGQSRGCVRCSTTRIGEGWSADRPHPFQKLGISRGKGRRDQQQPAEQKGCSFTAIAGACLPAEPH
jgi:hypothetical protein